MKNVNITLETEFYDLNLTFKPSFVSSTYKQVEKNVWKKFDSPMFRGFTVRQEKRNILIKGLVSIDRGRIEDFVFAETGLWHAPFEYDIHKVSKKFRWFLEELSYLYSGVRIPVSLFEQDKIFVAVCLSKRADYEVFVRSWMEKILEKYGNNVLDIVYASKEDLLKIGTSYQIFDLIDTLKSATIFHKGLENLPTYVKEHLQYREHFENPFKFLSTAIPPQVARMVLISKVKGIGPKTADSFLLNTSFHTDIAPVDTHLRNVVTRLQLFGENLKAPQSNLCSKYVCRKYVSRKLKIPLCPMSNSCIRAKILELRELAGWFQTLIYLFGREYCRKNKPQCDTCPLKKDCNYFSSM